MTSHCLHPAITKKLAQDRYEDAMRIRSGPKGTSTPASY